MLAVPAVLFGLPATLYGLLKCRGWRREQKRSDRGGDKGDDHLCMFHVETPLCA